MRRWLNKEFVKKAFTEQELSLIQTSKINNNVGPSTQDRVFLLSSDEARSLFSSDRDRKCKPTDYDFKKDSWVYGGGALWWLRSRGNRSSRAAIVGVGGGIYDNSVEYVGGSVRPALRLAI